MRNKLLWSGAAASTAYVAAMLWFFGGRLNALLGQNLNEVGDFLAGVFSPLAFLWLVLGFIQQGKELQLSSSALQMQADELRSAVVQQTALVEAQNETLKNYENSIEPFFDLYIFMSKFRLINRGTHCEDLSLELRVGDDVVEEKYYGTLTRDEFKDFSFFVKEERKSDSFTVVVAYRKISGSRNKQCFDLVYEGGRVVIQKQSWGKV